MQPCLTIDSLISCLNQEDFEKVVVKIDAEGFEKQCLEGMREFIKRCKFLDILLTIHSEIINPVHGYTVEDFYELLKKLELKKIDSEDFRTGIELHVKK